MRKYVRFNYFEIQLIPAEAEVHEQLGEEYDYHAADTWNMTRFLDYLMVNRETFETTVDIGGEYSEVEKDSYVYDERRDLYHFQLSKLRETNIPSKKRFGEIKEEILLNQDEFIGEFNSIIYDSRYRSVAVQSNFYGLTVKQTEQVLTELRFRYLDAIGESDEHPLIVKLVPIIDRSKVERVANADYYKKIRIKGSDVMLDANLGDGNLMSEAREMLHEASGVNIDLTISLGRSARTASLDNESIARVIRQFRAIEGENKPQIELTALYNEEAETEVVNLIEPRMTDRIPIEVEPRQTVGHEYLLQQFLEKYDNRRPDIRRVLVQIGE